MSWMIGMATLKNSPSGDLECSHKLIHCLKFLCQSLSSPIISPRCALEAPNATLTSSFAGKCFAQDAQDRFEAVELLSARIADFPHSCAPFHRSEEFGLSNLRFEQRLTTIIIMGIQIAGRLISGENPTLTWSAIGGDRWVEEENRTSLGSPPHSNLCAILRRWSGRRLDRWIVAGRSAQTRRHANGFRIDYRIWWLAGGTTKETPKLGVGAETLVWRKPKGYTWGPKAEDSKLGEEVVCLAQQQDLRAEPYNFKENPFG